jgi:dihydroneopterin aldolase
MSKAKLDPVRRVISPFPGVQPRPGEAHTFVRDLVLMARIGVHQHERVAGQRVRINLDLTVTEPGNIDDDLDKVVCYAGLVTGIRRVVGEGHINLVETLAERIAAMCLEDARVKVARVSVEKLDVYPEAESVGIAIERRRAGWRPAD